MKKVVPQISLFHPDVDITHHLINFLFTSVGLFLCNGNTGLKWQGGCMGNIVARVIDIFSSSKRNLKLQHER